MMNKTFSFKLHADGEGAVLNTPLGNAVEYITNLYTNAEKTPVTNNSITYNTAQTISLMNDRLGGTTEDLDGGNIRYYGASPKNYILFNCSDYSNQTSSTCETWRIIGVFEGKLKLIRNESIGTMSWDQKETSVRSSNNWPTATLQNLLNEDYYSGVETIEYYSGYQGNTIISLDMTIIGLKSEITRGMIQETTWSLGGWNDTSLYPNQIYEYERGTTVYSGNATTWTGKIALAYPSDYGYAGDLNKCSKINSNICNRTTDWLFEGFAQWVLTHGTNGGIWSANNSNGFTTNMVGSSMLAVRPVLYLDSELEIESGDGTSSNPYKLSV